MGIYQTTAVGCPLCGNRWKVVHTYHTAPIFGKCEKCGFQKASGVNPRAQIEHRRPKTLPDADYYGSGTYHE